MQVVLIQMMCQPCNKRKMVLLRVLYKSVFPCSSTSQELEQPSLGLRIRTLVSSLARKLSDFSSHLLLASLFSSFPDFISDKLMRISRDQMMRLSQTIGSSPRRRCRESTLSYHGSGIFQLFSLTSWSATHCWDGQSEDPRISNMIPSSTLESLLTNWLPLQFGDAPATSWLPRWTMEWFTWCQQLLPSVASSWQCTQHSSFLEPRVDTSTPSWWSLWVQSLPSAWIIGKCKPRIWIFITSSWWLTTMQSSSPKE